MSTWPRTTRSGPEHFTPGRLLLRAQANVRAREYARLYEAGATLQEIGNHFGVTWQAVQNALVRRGFKGFRKLNKRPEKAPPFASLVTTEAIPRRKSASTSSSEEIDRQIDAEQGSRALLRACARYFVKNHPETPLADSLRDLAA